MTEDEARQWVRDCYGVSRETQLEQLAKLIAAESAHQNLVSTATLPLIWARHIVDSAQLVPIVGLIDGTWIDIGSGAGFPGLVVALLVDSDVTLIEPRRKRADFLTHAAAVLGLTARVRVATCRVEAFTGAGDVISARAVAALPELFTAAAHLSTAKTRWILPKGKSAREEVAIAQRAWHGVFHVKHSLTDPDSLIILAEKVVRR